MDLPDAIPSVEKRCLDSVEEDSPEVTVKRFKGEDLSPTEMHPWSYTQGTEFTSEIFKIKVTNLPNKFGFSELKRRFEKETGVRCHKIKSPRDQNLAYVCYKNEEERQRALERINNHVWKGKCLKAELADPVADPYFAVHQGFQGDKHGRKDTKGKSHLKQGKNCSDEQKHLVPVESMNLTAEEAENILRDNVTPLWKMEYSEQLKTKYANCKSVLKKLLHHHLTRSLEVFKDKSKSDGMACPLLDIIPSPQVTQYRNKNEFAIGYGLDGKTLTVGFRYGLYKNGSTSVGAGLSLGLALPYAETVALSFRDYLTTSDLVPYMYQTGSGHWQTLTVRSFSTGDVMAIVDIVTNGLPQTKIDEVVDSVKAYYTSGNGKDVKIDSFYLRFMSQKGQTRENDNKILVFGDSYVHETVLGFKFRVSPDAFFQVNTAAAEKLYTVVQDWSGKGESTTILDVCCGTGTIGLCMAKQVKEIIGIDSCTQAVEDARANAALNGITNATFYSSKVEDVIGRIMTSFPSTPEKNLVAIVDPPRAGLAKTVLKVLRKHKGIQRLIFVSCNPNLCLENFVDLIRQPSNNLPGDPFTLVQAVPVDLFPGAKHCEMVLLFERNTMECAHLLPNTSESKE